MQKKWQCRIAPSLGAGFAGTPNEVWGTIDYADNFIDNEKPAIFFGLYGLPDFYALWQHKGRKAILWCGSDITHFINGYWLDEQGSIKLSPSALATWINKNCESWVENKVEAKVLEKAGIKAKVCPSFLGNIDDYEISFKSGNKLYTSVSGDNFKLYGWHLIEELAYRNPEIKFYLYGNTKKFESWNTNVIVRGRISREEMNAEIKEMQGALRLTEMDGFSEILAKSILWGQWPVSLIKYPHILSLNELSYIKNKEYPNTAGRSYYRRILNKYPWNLKK